jgi:hypothetical protein
MSLKQWLFLALAVGLGGLSVYLNKDWFAKDDIQIFHRSRPARYGFMRRGKRPDTGPVDPLFFSLSRALKLTSLKVIPESDIATNKYPHPIWYLVSDSNSVPVTQIIYGARIPGMRPSVPGATADPLEPGAKYRLLIEAGSVKAQHTFEPMPRTP